MGLDFLAGAYPTLRTEVLPGSALLLYSDGLSECLDHNGEPFGPERLQRAFAATAGFSSARKRLDRIMQAIANFRGNQDFNDDVTAILLVKN